MDFLSFDEGEVLLLNGGISGDTVYFLISSKALPANVNAPALGELGGGDTLAGGVGEVIYWTGGGRQSQVLAAPSGAGVIPIATETWNTGAFTDGPAIAKSIVMVSSSDNSGKAIAAWPITDDVGTHVVADLSNVNVELELVGVNYFFLNIGET